ncbi:hypothetical protein PMAYCL1PPCAC_14628, partial [Pristionchus mayeri]
FQKKPVNVVTPHQISQPLHQTQDIGNIVEKHRHANFQLNELRQREEAAQLELLQLREQRAALERAAELARKNVLEFEEMKRKRAAEQRALAINQLAKEKADLAMRRDEMEKEIVFTNVTVESSILFIERFSVKSSGSRLRKHYLQQY